MIIYIYNHNNYWIVVVSDNANNHNYQSYQVCHGGSLKMNGLFHGKSYENMDDLGVPPWIGNHHISTTNPIIDVLFPLVG